MSKFRKKPVVIEAVQWTGEMTPDLEAHFGNDPINLTPSGLVIKTLEGFHDASVGDWIIRGIKGELYPCKPDIFEATYEPVD